VFNSWGWGVDSDTDTYIDTNADADTDIDIDIDIDIDTDIYPYCCLSGSSRISKTTIWVFCGFWIYIIHPPTIFSPTITNTWT